MSKPDFNSKEVRHENLEEEEHTHHKRHNKDENTKTNKCIKRRTHIKGINTDEGCSNNQKLALKKQVGRDNESKGETNTDFGQKYATNEDESFVKISKKDSEVDTDVKGRKTYSNDNNRSASFSKSAHEDENKARSVEVDKQKKVAVKKSEAVTAERKD